MQETTVETRTVEEQAGIIRDILSKDTAEIAEFLELITQEEVAGSFPLTVEIRSAEISGKISLRLHKDSTVQYLAQIPITVKPRDLQNEVRMVKMSCEAVSRELTGEVRSYESESQNPIREEYFLIYYLEYSESGFSYNYSNW